MDESASAGAAGAGRESVDKIVELQRVIIEKDPSLRGRGLRGQHPRQHGCVKARFEVLADLPDRLKVGLFARPATYTAYVRFSNGKVLDDDRKPDIHGMAIKLTGVPGRKLLEAEADATTHDFVLADNPVFFIRTADDYVRLTTELAAKGPTGSPTDFIAWLKGNRPADLPVLANFRNHVCASPLATRYWGQVPYAFGPGEGTVCRYSAIPHDGNLKTPIPDAERGPDYLRETMALHLTRDKLEARFDFAIQVHKGATPAVIDNPTVEWDEPFERVAVITIPPQTFDTPERQAFGESLSYTPWHALPEHRPVGQINEIRKKVYVDISTLRHETRPALRAEPTGTEHWS